MDRHICGACNTEINDIDEFVVHKKQTCPAIQQRANQTKEDTPNTVELESLKNALVDQGRNESPFHQQELAPKAVDKPCNTKSDNTNSTHCIVDLEQSQAGVPDTIEITLKSHKALVHETFVMEQISTCTPPKSEISFPGMEESSVVKHSADTHSFTGSSVVYTPPPGHEYIQTMPKCNLVQSDVVLRGRSSLSPVAVTMDSTSHDIWTGISNVSLPVSSVLSVTQSPQVSTDMSSLVSPDMSPLIVPVASLEKSIGSLIVSSHKSPVMLPKTTVQSPILTCDNSSGKSPVIFTMVTDVVSNAQTSEIMPMNVATTLSSNVMYPSDMSQVVSSVKAPIMSTSSSVSAELWSTTNVNSEEEITTDNGITSEVIRQDLQMVLDQNGRYSLIRSSCISSFCQPSDAIDLPVLKDVSIQSKIDSQITKGSVDKLHVPGDQLQNDSEQLQTTTSQVEKCQSLLNLPKPHQITLGSQGDSSSSILMPVLDTKSVSGPVTEISVEDFEGNTHKSGDNYTFVQEMQMKNPSPFVQQLEKFSSVGSDHMKTRIIVGKHQVNMLNSAGNQQMKSLIPANLLKVVSLSLQAGESHQTSVAHKSTVPLPSSITAASNYPVQEITGDNEHNLVITSGQSIQTMSAAPNVTNILTTDLTNQQIIPGEVQRGILANSLQWNSQSDGKPPKTEQLKLLHPQSCVGMTQPSLITGQKNMLQFVSREAIRLSTGHSNRTELSGQGNNYNSEVPVNVNLLSVFDKQVLLEHQQQSSLPLNTDGNNHTDKELPVGNGADSSENRKVERIIKKDLLISQNLDITSVLPRDNKGVKQGVSLLQKDLVEKLKEKLNPGNSNDCPLIKMINNNASISSTGPCQMFEKSIAIQTDPVHNSINEGNMLMYMTDQQETLGPSKENVEQHLSKHNNNSDLEQNSSSEQDDDLNDSFISNNNESNMSRTHIQNPVSEILLAQDSPESNYDTLHRNSAETASVTTSLVSRQQEVGSTLDQLIYTSPAGIQYVVHKMSDGNYGVPASINKSTNGGETNQFQIQHTNKSKTLKHTDITDEAISPTEIHYTVHLETIDASKTIDGQILQIVRTPERYSANPSTSSSSPTKKTTNKPNKDIAKKYICTYDNCNFSTLYHKDLTRHIRTHTGEKPFACGMCEKRFSRLDKLRLHIRAHTGERPFQCDACDYRAVDASTLKKHAIIHTDQRPHICQLCNYKCRTSSQLTVHLRTHTGDRPFPCPHCSSKFKIKSDLRRHLRTHTGEKPYKCDKCDVKCTTQGNLHSHIKVHHSAERQLKCRECDYKTSSNRSMRDHVKCHEPLDPDNTCQICQFKCASHDILKRHMVTHKNDYYTCSQCEFITRHYSNLELHVQRKHNDHHYERQKKSGKSTNSDNKKGHIDSDRKRCKNEKTVYSKFQRLYQCNHCDESFVRQDSLKSHIKVHEELSSNNLKLSTAMTVLKLQKPVLKEPTSKRSGPSCTIAHEQSDDIPTFSSEEEHTPKSKASERFHHHDQGIDYEEETPDSDISESYFRNDLDDELHNSVLNRVPSQNFRRQLDFDTASSALLQGRTLLNKRRSLDTSSKSKSDSQRLSIENASEHSRNKRSKSTGGNLREFSRSQKELHHTDITKRRDNSKLYSEHTSIPSQRLDTFPKSHNLNPVQVAPQTVQTIRPVFTDSQNKQYQILPQQQQIYQVPNIQLVQNITLPLVRLPDGQIVSLYGGPHIGNQMHVQQPIINTGFIPTPGNENIQTIQLVSAPGMISPCQSADSGQNVQMQQMVELVDSLGNPVSAQFVVPQSLETAEEAPTATVETVDITRIQDNSGMLEQMMAQHHVMTLPLHVLDMPQNN